MNEGAFQGPQRAEQSYVHGSILTVQAIMSYWGELGSSPITLLSNRHRPRLISFKLRLKERGTGGGSSGGGGRSEQLRFCSVATSL